MLQVEAPVQAIKIINRLVYCGQSYAHTAIYQLNRRIGKLDNPEITNLDHESRVMSTHSSESHFYDVYDVLHDEMPPTIQILSVL